MQSKNTNTHHKNGFFAVLVAGGIGKRFGHSKPKQFCLLENKPILKWSAEVFLSMTECLQLVIVSHPDWISATEDIIYSSAFSDKVLIIPGGITRQASCRNGIMAIDADDLSPVLIHDAARPWVTRRLVKTVYNAVLTGNDAVIPIDKSTDSIVICKNNVVVDYPDRTNVAHVQTPQGFRLGVIRKAHLEAMKSQTDDYVYPDDGVIALKAGYPVVTVSGEPENRKVTLPGDTA